MDDPAVFGWAWPVFGTAAALSTVLVSWRLHEANRLKVWAGAHVVMAFGVLLPVLWMSLAGYFVMVCWVMNVGRTPGPANAAAPGLNAFPA